MLQEQADASSTLYLQATYATYTNRHRIWIPLLSFDHKDSDIIYPTVLAP